jgi:uncharacterized protein YbaP (TraB family)
MKKSVSFLFSVVFIFTICLVARGTGNDNSHRAILYEISGKGLQTSSYLFGTVHLIPKDQFEFPQILPDRMDRVDALVLEVDINIPIKEQISMVQRMMLPNNSTLKEYMDDEMYNTTVNYFIDSMQVSEKKVQRYMHFKPVHLLGFILIEYYGNTESYEQNLYKAAIKHDKEILALETLDFQLDLLDSISIEEQLKDFSVSELIYEYEALLDVYLKYDIEELEKYMEEDEDFEDYEEMLMIKRNYNWLPKLVEFMTDKSVFVAVGAGHLMGEEGIIRLLENEGYIVKACK